MQEQEKQTAKGRDLYEWVQSLVGSVLVVVAIFTFVIRMMGVDGHSMLNTLQHGDRLLVVNSMLYHDYKYGDIVILRKNGVFDDDPIVKRVIAVEGQTVDIDFVSGAVYVDGKTWTARSSDGSVIPIGTKVTVERMEGVKLFVTPERTPCGTK